MARPRKKTDEEVADSLTQEMVKKEEVSIEDMPLNTLADYVRYNRRARELNKKLKMCRYKIKQCPVELHPHERVIFTRNDQPTNPLPVYLSNELIHYDRTKLKDQLIPGKEYDLPRCVIDHLAKRGTSVWKWVDKPDGSRETIKAGMVPRFSLRTVYKD